MRASLKPGELLAPGPDEGIESNEFGFKFRRRCCFVIFHQGNNANE